MTFVGVAPYAIMLVRCNASVDQRTILWRRIVCSPCFVCVVFVRADKGSDKQEGSVFPLGVSACRGIGSFGLIIRDDVTRTAVSALIYDVITRARR